MTTPLTDDMVAREYSGWEERLYEMTAHARRMEWTRSAGAPKNRPDNGLGAAGAQTQACSLEAGIRQHSPQPADVLRVALVAVLADLLREAEKSAAHYWATEDAGVGRHWAAREDERAIRRVMGILERNNL